MRVVLYQLLNSLSQKMVGPALRTAGKKLYEYGNQLEGQQLSQDRLTPSLRNLTYQGKQPDLQYANFVAPTSVVLGDVKLGQNSSIWYGATVLGTTPIKIGSNTVIQDRVYVSKGATIGDNVFVGPNSILQGSKLQSQSFVSMGATVKHATIKSGGFVAAGAVIPDGAEVKEGEIWAGNPGRFLRNISPLERQVLKQHLQQMHELALIHSQQTEKTTRQVLNGPNYRQDFSVNVEEYLKDTINYNFAYSPQDSQFIEQRILLKETMEYPEWGTDYEPYQFENKNVSEKFKIGKNEQQFAEVALKLKQKQSFKDRKPWDNAY